MTSRHAGSGCACRHRPMVSAAKHVQIDSGIRNICLYFLLPSENTHKQTNKQTNKQTHTHIHTNIHTPLPGLARSYFERMYEPERLTSFDMMLAFDSYSAPVDAGALTINGKCRDFKRFQRVCMIAFIWWGCRCRWCCG